MGDFRIMDRGKDTQRDTHTDTHRHINTMTRPGLRAGRVKKYIICMIQYCFRIQGGCSERYIHTYMLINRKTYAHLFWPLFLVSPICWIKEHTKLFTNKCDIDSYLNDKFLPVLKGFSQSVFQELKRLSRFSCRPCLPIAQVKDEAVLLAATCQSEQPSLGGFFGSPVSFRSHHPPPPPRGSPSCQLECSAPTGWGLGEQWLIWAAVQ